MIEEAIQRIVDEATAKYEASKRPRVPTPDEEIATRLRQARFRESIGDLALCHNVRPSAIRHIVREAEELFELRDGTFIARNDAIDPSDPLAPLTPGVWLEQLARTDGYLFTTLDGKAH